jgi:putative transposase
MTAVRFAPGQRFVWNETEYEVKRAFPKEQKVNIEAVHSGAVLVEDLRALTEALFTGDLVFVIPDVPNVKRTDKGRITLDDYPEQNVAVARYREAVIKPLVELSPRERSRDVVEQRVAEVREAWNPDADETSLQTACSVSSVYRWMRMYRRANKDLRVLIPQTFKSGGIKQSRLHPYVEATVRQVIEDMSDIKELVTVDDVYHEIAVRLEEEVNAVRGAGAKLPLPDRSTVARRINEVRAYCHTAFQHGRRLRNLAQYRRTAYPKHPLERVEIDHTRLDLIVIADEDDLPLGRLNFTLCVDMATRYPLGIYLGFEPPSVYAVMECLRHAILPKTDYQEIFGIEHPWQAYGVPGTLVIDNGKEFIGKDLEDACDALGIILQRTPVKMPHFKAGVERLYGTINTGLIHKLPGTTFSNPQKRGEYQSGGQACIYYSQVAEILIKYLVNVYAETFHRGLESIPARRWEQLTEQGFAPRLPPSAKELDILLGRVAYRAVHTYGIDLHHIRYNCGALSKTRQFLKPREQVKVKYNPGDLSEVYVFDPYMHDYVTVPALDQEYTQDLSLWKHRVIRAKVAEEKKEVNLVNLGLAKREIQAIVRRSLRSKKGKRGSRTKVARWLSGGKPAWAESEANAWGEEAEAAAPAEPLMPEDCEVDVDLNVYLD